ncbi:MAG: aminotransferase class V-fold PLP-dependent enzyme, partial [Dehalococcoidales bacterium]
EMGVDLLSMSAHKLYGPKGIGALYIRKGTRLVAFMHGGEQERGRRASTENVPGIVGFGHAVTLAIEEMSAEAGRLTSLRNRLIDGLTEKIDHIRQNGHPTQRLPNNINISIAYVEGESMCLNLDFDGICVSTGSACSSSSTDPSHVMLALGMTPLEAHSSLRMSLGRWTTEEDIDAVLEVLPRVTGKLRDMSPLLKNK